MPLADGDRRAHGERGDVTQAARVTARDLDSAHLEARADAGTPHHAGLDLHRHAALPGGGRGEAVSGGLHAPRSPLLFGIVLPHGGIAAREGGVFQVGGVDVCRALVLKRGVVGSEMTSSVTSSASMAVRRNPP